MPDEMKSERVEIPPEIADMFQHQKLCDWLLEPDNRKTFLTWRKAVRAGNWEAVPPEFRADVAWAIKKWFSPAWLQIFEAKVKAAETLMDQCANAKPNSDRMAQINLLLDEASDALLDAPEPHRTRLFQHLIPLREDFRKLAIQAAELEGEA